MYCKSIVYTTMRIIVDWNLCFDWFILCCNGHIIYISWKKLYRTCSRGFLLSPTTLL